MNIKKPVTVDFDALNLIKQKIKEVNEYLFSQNYNYEKIELFWQECLKEVKEINLIN